MKRIRPVVLILLVAALAAALMVGCTKKLDDPQKALNDALASSLSADTYYLKHARNLDATNSLENTLNVHASGASVTAHRQIANHGALSTSYQNSYYGTPKGANEGAYFPIDYKKGDTPTPMSAAQFFALPDVAPYTIGAFLAPLAALPEGAYRIASATQMGRMADLELVFDAGTANPYSDKTTLYVELTNGKISKVTDDANSPTFTVHITYMGPNITLP